MKNERTSKRRMILILAAAILVIALFGLGLHLIEKHGEEDEQFGDTGDWGKDGGASEEIVLAMSDRDYYTTDDIDIYLLFGTDDKKQGEDGFNGEMADFLALLVIDNTTEKYAIIQIDRNTMTVVDVLDENGESIGGATEQICVAHWYGMDAEQRNNNTVAAVSNLFGGLPIDGYYSINMKDIGAVNHAIGGVVVDIDTDMTNVDPEFVKGASVLLDDRQAELFVRARTNVGDGTNEGRMGRQRQYIQKVYNLVISQLRDNPDYINDLYNELSERVVTDRPGRDFSVLAAKLTQYESLGILTLDGRTEIGDTLPDGEEHEEFYPAEMTVISTLRKVMNISTESSVPDETDEEDEEG